MKYSVGKWEVSSRMMCVNLMFREYKLVFVNAYNPGNEKEKVKNVFHEKLKDFWTFFTQIRR